MMQENHDSRLGRTVLNDSQLFLQCERLKTFKGWPNDPDWFCTPEKLAKAGFYFNPSEEALDNVCCAFCGKELDGWEPDDNPEAEHASHSSKCPYLKLRKPVEELTIEDFVKFYKKIALLLKDKAFSGLKEELTSKAKDVRNTINDIYDEEI